jgi:general secretion pathway protein G
MMVVLMIIGLVAGLITVNVRVGLISAKQNAAKSDISTIVSAIEQFFLITGKYPSADEGLRALTQPIGTTGEPALDAIPKDPWKNSYIYNRPGPDGSPYEVISFGADNQEGGEGADSDIANWNLRDDD